VVGTIVGAGAVVGFVVGAGAVVAGSVREGTVAVVVEVVVAVVAEDVLELWVD